MSYIKTIMAAVDFSKYSPAMTRYAWQLAKALDAELLFINVINQRDVDTVHRVMASYGTFEMDQYTKERMRERHDQINELIAGCEGGGPKYRTMVRVGVPYQEILEAIEEEKPDLLVIAAKGRSDIVDLVMGSCARVMHQRCPIPVLSIREKTASERTAV